MQRSTALMAALHEQLSQWANDFERKMGVVEESSAPPPESLATEIATEIEIATERMTSVLEPIMIIGLAIVVGFIVISIVLPILKMGQV